MAFCGEFILFGEKKSKFMQIVNEYKCNPASLLSGQSDTFGEQARIEDSQWPAWISSIRLDFVNRERESWTEMALPRRKSRTSLSLWKLKVVNAFIVVRWKGRTQFLDFKFSDYRAPWPFRCVPSTKVELLLRILEFEESFLAKHDGVHRVHDDPGGSYASRIT